MEFSPSLVAGDGTADTGGGAAARSIGTGRIKRKGPASPSASIQAFPEFAGSSEGNGSERRGKRYRPALDDDEVVVLEPEDRVAAPGEKSDTKAGASVAIKPEL